MAVMSRSSVGLRLPVLFFKVLKRVMGCRDIDRDQVLPPDERIPPRYVKWREIAEVDPVLYRSLESTWKHDYSEGEDDGGMAMLDLRFVYIDSQRWPECVLEEGKYAESAVRSVERELLPGGADVRVNNMNKERFCDLFATQHLLGRRLDAFRFFANGLLCVLPRSFFERFEARELRDLICSREHIDVVEWRDSVTYEDSGGDTPEQDILREDSKTVQWFWQWVEEGDEGSPERAERHANLLEFWSGSRHPPVFGFTELDGDEDVASSGFKICRAVGRKKNSLPTAATCDRRLELPTYKSYSMLAKMMQIAVEFGVNGFTED